MQENYTDDRSGNTFIFALQCVGLLMGGISALTSCRAIVSYRQLDGPLFRLDAFDLIMYLWVCISLIVLLNLHLKLRSQHELITALARAIALANACSATEGARLRSTDHDGSIRTGADRPALRLARDASYKESTSTVRTAAVDPTL